MDTLAMANQDRKDNGPWEVEVSYGGEADLHQQLKNCNKNPNHLNFIPVDKFNIEHLPSDYQDTDLVDFVKAMSNITVRLSVKYVSEERPATFNGSDKMYPFYNKRGSTKLVMVGTGWVWNVQLYSKKDSVSCPCKVCVNSPTQKTQFARIDIRTAAHVVYDSHEGAHTTCHLFYDKGPSPEKCEGVVKLTDNEYVIIDADKDSCSMIYTTHDLELAEKLEKMTILCRHLADRLTHKYPSAISGNPRFNSRNSDLEKLTILCSNRPDDMTHKYHRALSGNPRLFNSQYSDLEKMTILCHHLADRLTHKYPSAISGNPRLNSLKPVANSEPSNNTLSPCQSAPDGWDKLTIIVSHPHGCSKQVSVGCCTGKDDKQAYLTKYIYNAPTCPGCSGSPVLLLEGVWGLSCDHAHSGGDGTEEQQLNFSSSGVTI